MVSMIQENRDSQNITHIIFFCHIDQMVMLVSEKAIQAKYTVSELCSALYAQVWYFGIVLRAIMQDKLLRFISRSNITSPIDLKLHIMFVINCLMMFHRLNHISTHYKWNYTIHFINEFSLYHTRILPYIHD